MADGRILYAIRDRVCFLKFVGDANHAATVGLDSLINELFENDLVEDVLVDLTETTYIDSTSLGELTKLSDLLMRRRSRKATIVSTQSGISEVLCNLGLDQVFVVVDSPPGGAGELHELPAVQLSERQNALRILEAHRKLMELNEKTGQEFRTVVDVLEQELQRQEHRQDRGVRDADAG
jgi:anti-anti-sigma factor